MRYKSYKNNNKSKDKNNLEFKINKLEALLSDSYKLSMEEAINNHYVDKFYYESRL